MSAEETAETVPDLDQYLIDFVELGTRGTISLNPASVDCVMPNADPTAGGTEIHFKSGLSVVVCGEQDAIAAAINLAVVMSRSTRRKR